MNDIDTQDLIVPTETELRRLGGAEVEWWRIAMLRFSPSEADERGRQRLVREIGRREGNPASQRLVPETERRLREQARRWTRALDAFGQETESLAAAIRARSRVREAAFAEVPRDAADLRLVRDRAAERVAAATGVLGRRAVSLPIDEQLGTGEEEAW